MIVLDASVLIAHLDRNDLHHARAEAVLADAGAEALLASPLTVAEVLVAPARRGRLDAAEAALATLEIQVVPLGADAPRRLASLRAETDLRMPDCAVLLAAEAPHPDGDGHAGVATFDQRLGAVGRRRGLRVLPAVDSPPPIGAP